jgi:hypothetical protein
VIPPAVALTVNVADRLALLEDGKVKLIDVALPPDATEAVACVAPARVHVHVADCVQLMVLEALCGWTLKLDRVTGLPALAPPAGVNVTFDLPRRLSIEIVVPDVADTPASVRTADSLSEIVAVDDRPSSVFTSDIEMVPVGRGIS